MVNTYYIKFIEDEVGICIYCFKDRHVKLKRKLYTVDTYILMSMSIIFFLFSSFRPLFFLLTKYLILGQDAWLGISQSFNDATKIMLKHPNY